MAKNTNDEELVIKKYIRSKRKRVCRIANKILKEIENSIEGAPINQLSSVLGTILDKFGSDEKSENTEGILAKVFEDFEDVK